MHFYYYVQRFYLSANMYFNADKKNYLLILIKSVGDAIWWWLLIKGDIKKKKSLEKKINFIRKIMKEWKMISIFGKI